MRRRWPAGAALLREGDSSDHVLVIETGRVKVTSSATSGKQVLLAIRGPDDLVGEFAAIDGSERSATVTALSLVSAVVIQGSEFRAILIKDGKAAVGVLRIVVNRVREADKRRLEYGAYTVDERIARLLLDYSELYGRTDGDRVLIALPLSQAELAHAAGASREAVVKALKRLRDQGAVRTARRRVELLRPELLGEIARDLPSVYSDADVPRHPR
ncbi:Crp/Fnr family transcriptional regulator [Nocardia sp. NPDC059246]|uniref:Crp/Fnr family transcriptional regulator n=1 Tax=unclassified Nocardia TaxID=2637762 RepID=UPI0036BBD803